MGKAIEQTRAGATTAPRQSLAATHPSNYVKAAGGQMPPLPPPAPTLARQESASETANAKFSSTALSLKHPYPTPTPSPPEKLLDNSTAPTTGKQALTYSPARQTPNGRSLIAQGQAELSGAEQRAIGRPWEQHNDPTFTVSDSPPYWTRNHTVLKTDTNVENGSVLSPTYMHGLPFGSMTEAAHHYPSEEGLSCLK